MPELPEVETIARTLAPQIEGRVITAVHILNPGSLAAGHDLLPLLTGARIERAHRRAKLLLVSARARSEELLLVFHLKMTGSFFVHPAGTEPLTHTRLIFDLEGGAEARTAPGNDKEIGTTTGKARTSQPDAARSTAPDAGQRLFFDDTRKFGWCRILRPADLAAWDFWAGLGPEPLEASVEDLARHLGGVFRGKSRAVKAALLDQTVVAGIGNIYADESLFKAGIAPQCPCGGISEKKLLALAGAVQSVLGQSIRECGSSIRDYRDARGNAGAFQNNFAVYGRKGQTCQACGRALKDCRVAGRSTVYCPTCQK